MISAEKFLQLLLAIIALTVKIPDMKNFISNFLALFFAVGTSSAAYADTSNFNVIDVRTTGEYSSGHVKDSTNIDFLKPDFKEQILKLDKTKTYKLYCRSGNRSGQAMKLMKSLGFKDVENLGSLSQAAKKLNRTCEPINC